MDPLPPYEVVKVAPAPGSMDSRSVIFEQMIKHNDTTMNETILTSEIINVDIRLTYKNLGHRFTYHDINLTCKRNSFQESNIVTLTSDDTPVQALLSPKGHSLIT